MKINRQRSKFSKNKEATHRICFISMNFSTLQIDLKIQIIDKMLVFLSKSYTSLWTDKEQVLNYISIA